MWTVTTVKSSHYLKKKFVFRNHSRESLWTHHVPYNCCSKQPAKTIESLIKYTCRPVYIELAVMLYLFILSRMIKWRREKRCENRMNGSMCIAPSDDISSYQMIGLIALISYCGITKLKKENWALVMSHVLYILSRRIKVILMLGYVMIWNTTTTTFFDYKQFNKRNTKTKKNKRKKKSWLQYQHRNKTAVFASAELLGLGSRCAYC